MGATMKTLAWLMWAMIGVWASECCAAPTPAQIYAVYQRLGAQQEALDAYAQRSVPKESWEASAAKSAESTAWFLRLARSELNSWSRCAALSGLTQQDRLYIDTANDITDMARRDALASLRAARESSRTLILLRIRNADAGELGLSIRSALDGVLAELQ